MRRDVNLLVAVDHGDRLAEMRGRLSHSVESGRTVIQHYQFDAVTLQLIVPFGVQTGVSLGFVSRGTVVEETYDANGALQGRESAPFELTFAVRRATGSRWFNVGVLTSG